MWTRHNLTTSVNTLSDPVPVTGQVVWKASPTSTMPACDVRN